MIGTCQHENVRTEKLRKIKAGNRCHSASSLRESKNKVDSSRTRSVSPTSKVPPLQVDLPLKKFYKIYSKIVVQLETVKSFAENKTNETDSLIDLKRQLQRADEFTIRFSRNNLYEMKRIMSDIKKVIVPHPFDKLTPIECKYLCRKLINGYHVASLALQTYINYAKNPSNLEVPEKITELIHLIADLFLCCEHLSFPPNEVYIQTDAMKICNELIALFSSKIPVDEYVDIKEAGLRKKKSKSSFDGVVKSKKFSMYQAKLTKSNVRDTVAKKKLSFLENKPRRMRKKDEKKARIEHEIYTQKLTAKPITSGGSGGANKVVKFESGGIGTGKPENMGWKKLRTSKFVASEVKSQDDDVETMVQAIGNEENMSSRTCHTSRGSERGSDTSSVFNKSSFRELLLEAIEDLKSSNKGEQKATLKKLLNSIQTCSSPRVKVYHFKSKDLEEEERKMRDQQKYEGNEEAEKPNFQPDVSLMEAHKEKKERNEILPQERPLNIIFKPIKEKRCQEKETEPAPRGKIKLRLPEDVINDINKYRKSFAEYRRNNIMYKKTLSNKPWELVGKFSDIIIHDVITEISQDFENDEILKKLYFNELLEVS